MKKFSIVVAIFNEEDNIEPLVENIHDALSDFDYEIILVNDGSKDNTVRNIEALNDPKIRLVELRKNYGQSAALGAGLDIAEGEWIATMDGDLQNDPKDIPKMLAKAERENLDVVAGIRSKRKDGIFLRKIPSKIANWLIRKATGLSIQDLGCALKVFKADIAKDIRLYGELHRFITILAFFEGGKIGQINVRHHARIHGKSKYGMNRTFKVMSDLILMLFLKKYMQKPIHLFGTFGLFIFAPGVIIDVYMLVMKIIHGEIGDRMPLLSLGILLTLGGIQLITVGIITEMQMRTYYESQSKRPYRVRSITYFNENTSEKAQKKLSLYQ